MRTTAQTDANGKPPGRIQSAMAPLSVHEVYPLEIFKRRSGLDDWALRQARRNGLRVLTVGRRRFVRGSDFAVYLDQIANEPATTTDT
jgi:hypothetical protein